MSVVWTRYGRPSYDALRAVVSELKRDDPLAPVTVLVPSQLCGVVARRTLAAGVAGRSGIAGQSGIAGRSGIAGLWVLTVDRLAEQLATPTLVASGRRPATDAVLAAAWRRALVEDAGVFGPVADHPATVRALVLAHRELREVDSNGLTAIAASGEPVAADVVRLHRRVVGLLSTDWYDVADLRRVAAEAVPQRPEIGTVVVFQPQDLASGATTLLAALAAATAVRVVAAVSGDSCADAAPQAPWATPARHESAPVATRVLHASDADDEVRCVVREVTAALRHTRAHRIAVLYGTAQPYARLLADHLAAAGVTWNGAGVRPTIERTLARLLLDALALPDHGWRRDEVFAVLAAAPMRDKGGRRLPVSRWERLSRIAGVVAGGDWDTRLKAYAAQERAAGDRERAAAAPRIGLVNRRERDAATADDLARFVRELCARLDEGGSLHTWPELSAWALDTFRFLTGDLADERWLPEDEARAAEKVTRTLAGLAGLHTVEATADLDALRTTLDLELADDLPRHGRFGTGVLIAPLSHAIGLDLDTVFVVGLAEDLVPGRLRGDALLPDRIRALTGGQLPPLRARVDRRHRQVLAALAAAPESVVSFPRGDLRRSSTRLPSRWLLPTLRALAHQPTADATGWQALTDPDIVGSRSYASSLTHTEHLASGQEWRIRAATARIPHTAADPVNAADPVIAAARTMLHARAGETLTRFDGYLSGHVVPDPSADGRIVSPTSLEAWTRCPHAYFVSRLLWVEPIASPEELVQITPLEIGSLIHLTLERFFDAQQQAGTVPAGATPWTAQQRAELHDIARQVADDFTVRGATGHPLLWRQELARILTDLDGLLDDDQKLREHTGRHQIRAELAFGMHGVPPVEVVLPDGRTVHFRGSADRVDRAGAGFAVVDYKTGSAAGFKELSESNPTAHGSKLQLPVYARAARAGLADPHADVSAEYWFLRKDRGTRKGLPLTPDVERRYAEALAVIVDGVAAGLYPHRPPEQDGFGGYVPCHYCDPDGCGVTEHRHRWERKRHDPRLAAYLRLIDDGTAT